MTLRVLMVCTGNICRSPTAEGVLQHRLRTQGLADAVWVDSAGTHGYHVGEAPDERSQDHAKRRGYDLSTQRARQVRPADYAAFDLILAMDRGHLEWLQDRCPPEHQAKLGLLLDHGRSRPGRDVPDPYYGGASGFELVLDLVEDACDGVITHLRQRLAKR